MIIFFRATCFSVLASGRGSETLLVGRVPMLPHPQWDVQPVWLWTRQSARSTAHPSDLPTNLDDFLDGYRGTRGWSLSYAQLNPAGDDGSCKVVLRGSVNVYPQEMLLPWQEGVLLLDAQVSFTFKCELHC